MIAANSPKKLDGSNPSKSSNSSPRRLIVTAREARALRDGATQVRRLITPQPLGVESREALVRRPPLVVGGVYWIAETWCPRGWRFGGDVARISYRVDGEDGAEMRDVRMADGWWQPDPIDTWRSAAAMPRWASRMSIVVEAVRVERVQDATEADCLAMHSGMARIQHMRSPTRGPFLDGLANEWDAEHPRAPWASNPWVAVGTVRRVEE